jgi:predicted  nucleic acid-binding Zn-ribbon protein
LDHLEQRILKLEYRMDDHQEELKKLQDISETLKKSLVGIEKTLSQIKWLSTGAFVAFFAQSIGLDKVIKLLLV